MRKIKPSCIIEEDGTLVIYSSKRSALAYFWCMACFSIFTIWFLGIYQSLSSQYDIIIISCILFSILTYMLLVYRKAKILLNKSEITLDSNKTYKWSEIEQVQLRATQLEENVMFVVLLFKDLLRQSTSVTMDNYNSINIMTNYLNSVVLKENEHL
ncbi:MAG TPA: hypothetical protein PLS50_08580, partial [Candidatus Dojkabacteria bacterium]|nr:hypothetical protein [Candidatus Dojkabacteria bacterium]